MSVKCMTAVFDRYPNGGGEMLLALAIADHADDKGENIFPRVGQLAEKTRQSERTIQYQLRLMRQAGWLIRVGNSHGGRSCATRYRISPEWLAGGECAPQKGAEIAPFPPSKGRKNCTLSGAKRVQSDAQKGATGCTRIEPSIDDDRDTSSSSSLEGKGAGEAARQPVADGVAPVADAAPMRSIADWVRWWGDEHGVEVDPHSHFDRRKFWPLATAWIAAGITATQMAEAIKRAREQSKTPIAYLPAYADKVLSTLTASPADRVSPSQQAAIDRVQRVSPGLAVGGTSRPGLPGTLADLLAIDAEARAAQGATA